MLRVASTAPLGAKGRLCAFSPPPGVTRELPKGRPRVSLPGQVGGRTDPERLCIGHLSSRAEASSHPGGTQGEEQDGRAWRRGR